MKTKLRVGIDPGTFGSVVMFIENIEKPFIYVIPRLGNEINIKKLRSILRGEDLLKNIEDYDTHIVIEDVHAVHNSSAAGTFSFGYTCGIIEAIVSELDVPYSKIQPKVWQKEMWIGIKEIRKPSKADENGKLKLGAIDTKTMSLIAAQKLFPNVKLTDPLSTRAVKPHDGIVDALLIAEYAKRRF